MSRPRRPHACAWCGREVPDSGVGRRRQYCRQSCRQRAYEQRSATRGTAIAEDAVILTAQEASELSDRVFEVRCAAEDVATAVAEGATAAELTALTETLVAVAREAERWR